MPEWYDPSELAQYLEESWKDSGIADPFKDRAEDLRVEIARHMSAASKFWHNSETLRKMPRIRLRYYAHNWYVDQLVREYDKIADDVLRWHLTGILSETDEGPVSPYQIDDALSEAFPIDEVAPESESGMFSALVTSGVKDRVVAWLAANFPTLEFEARRLEDAFVKILSLGGWDDAQEFLSQRHEDPTKPGWEPPDLPEEAWAQAQRIIRDMDLREDREAGYREPLVGDQVASTDYGGQPYLYHTTDEAHLPSIMEQGLVPGDGSRWQDPTTAEHARDRLFFSTQIDKWDSSAPIHNVRLRVPTDQVEAYYDGGLWIVYEDDDMYEGDRLADCYTKQTIPPELIEQEIEYRGGWEPLIDERFDQ